MRFLRFFDPWSGKLCSCRPKYSLSPYTGCGHKCLYCYITTYIPNAFTCRPKNDFIKNLPSDLKSADSSIPISMANSSDPYTPLESDLGITRNTLKLLTEFGFQVIIVTKSDLVVRDLDIISGGKVAVTVTINNDNEHLTSYLEPGAPCLTRRIKMVQKLLDASIPVLVRVDPIIPGLNENAETLLKELSEIGVKYITTSTYKARSDNLNRIKAVFPKQGLKLEKIYKSSGEYFNHSWYLPTEMRLKIMKEIAVLAKKYGLGFNVCREGLSIKRTSQSCDGQHLL